MKKIFFILLFAACFAGLQAQKVDRWLTVPYSRSAPASTNKPATSEPQIWYNTTASMLYRYNRTTKTWDSYTTTTDATKAYAEMSMSSDTCGLSFAATTALPVERVTAGLLSGFTMLSDSALRFDGAVAGVFRVSYSTTFSFGEAANIFNFYIIKNTTAQPRTEFKVTVATATAGRYTGAGGGLITLDPGDTVRLMAVPSAHTGTDLAVIRAANVNLVQVH